MGTLMKLTPLAVGLAVFALIVVFMVQRNMPIGTWLVAAFLLGHGLVHMMFVAPPPVAAGDPAAEFAFDPSRSWLVSAHIVDTSLLRLVVGALVATVIVGYGLAAAATVGILVPQAWWPALVVASTAASAGLMLIGLAPGLALGIAIDVVLLWLVVTASWAPGRLVPVA